MLCTLDELTTFMYLRQGEPMPDELDDPVADNAALVAWSEGSDPWEIDRDRLVRFLERTEQLLSELETLVIDPAEPVPQQYMTLFYEAAKDVFDHDKTQLRQYFAWFYLSLFHRTDGPRWGEFVHIYGVDNFIRLVRERFSNLLIVR